VTAERLGQHFLSDAGWREKIAREVFAGIAPGAISGTTPGAASGGVWIEIGAGHGEMTALVARHAEQVVAIELDAKLLPQLRERTAPLGNVTVVSGDVLELDLAELTGNRSFCVYGNLPYYITSPIVHRLFEHAEKLKAAFLVIQLEVAMRIAAQPGVRDYGYLSALAQFYSRPEILLRIPPGAFRPPPKVASALVALRPPGRRARLGVADERAFLEFVKRCFAQKRKTLRNNLRAVTEPERFEQILEGLGISGNARAEELTLEQFAALFTALNVSKRGRAKA
jgi:16S rRNA (adenine1518-N6/adenine1519-N6)-dimethyltransferase